ncbi:MAG: hypothetical protein DI538_07725, partial [Azospira oryzae]
MSLLEMINLSIVIAIGLCLIVRPSLISQWLKPTAVFLIVLACVQMVMSGYSWRYLSAYGLIVLITLWAFAVKLLNGNIVPRRILQGVLIIVLPMVLLPWAVFAPVPRLPLPIGSHQLGTRIFRWGDTNRHEEFSNDRLEHRNVIVQAWYPTEPKTKGRPAVYLDGLAKRPAKLGAIPTQIIDRYDQINTHAIREAPLSRAEDRWPVVLFLPGNGASRSFYTSLITHIASLGYVVLAIDHPYDAMITQLANGTVVTDIEQSLPPDFDRLQFMAHRTQTRIADVKFVLDELIKRARAAPFFSQLDVDRIVIAGHSLGGASGAMAMAFDPRIKAAVNIDGTTYGELPEIKSPRRFMLIESKKDGSDRFMRYEQGNQKLFHHFLGGVRYELPEADHF